MKISMIRFVRRTVLAACLSLSTIASKTQADVVYNSSGFEAPQFVPMLALEGQNGWQKNAGGSTATVSTNSPNGGFQSLQILRAANSNGDTRWSIGTSFTPSSTLNAVNVDVDMRVNLSGSLYGPAFGAEAYDGDKLIGALSVDAATGEVLYAETATGKLRSTGKVVSRGVYHQYSLETDFVNLRYLVVVDSKTVRIEPFVNATAKSLSIVKLATYSVNPATSESESGVAYLDNFAVTSKKVAAIPAAIPPAPTNLTAQGGKAQVTLNWNSSVGATSYNVHRRATAGDLNPTRIATKVTTTTYADTEAGEGTTYFYSVSAINSSGESPRANEVQASTAPPTPTNLTATGGKSQIKLSWGASAGAEMYHLYRGVGESEPVLYKSGLTSPSYIDEILEDGTTRSYTVTAVNSSGESNKSSVVSATTAAANLVVTDLQANPSSPGVGDSVVLTAKVTNASANTMASDQVVTFSDGETAIGTATIPSLAPDESKEVTVTWTAQSAGIHSLKATVSALAGEQNTADNVSAGEVMVYNYYTYTTNASLIGTGAAGSEGANKVFKYNIGVPMNVIRELRVIASVSTFDNSASSMLGKPNPYLESYTSNGTLDIALVGLVKPTGTGNWVMSSQDAAVTMGIRPLGDNYLNLYIKGLNSSGSTQDKVKVSGLTIQIKYLGP